MRRLCELNLFFGISGYSMKTKEGCDVVKEIPLDRILIETKSPYYVVRPKDHCIKYVKTKFHIKKLERYNPLYKKGFTLVRSRGEPCTIVQVVECIAALKEISHEEVAKSTYNNTIRCFNLNNQNEFKV